MEPFHFEARISEVMMNTVWQVVYVPFDAEQVFGARSGVDVCGTLDGVNYRRSLLSDGQGGWFFVLNAAMRKAIGKSLGDSVQVVLQRDDTYREVTLPDYFLDALAESPVAMQVYEKSPPSTRRWLLEFLTQPKSMDAKARRVLKAIEVLEKQARRTR